MHISSEVHNYMETLVGQILCTNRYNGQFDSNQLADIACLALIQLKPLYIRHDIDFLSSLPERKLNQLKQSAEIAVENAVVMLQNDRRKIVTMICLLFFHIPVMMSTKSWIGMKNQFLSKHKL